MPDPCKTAYLFPGQGAQYPGIGKDLHDQIPVVRDTYAEASEALGYDIAERSFHAPADEINLTRNTQPVLLTHSIACLRALHAHAQAGRAPPPSMAAGHSLGEYCALVSAGALEFAEALRLVKRRGELMGEYGQGEMEALMIDFDSAAALAGRHHCGIAACNLPEQTVVGGAAEDLDALLRDMAENFPRKRSVRLQTEGAFHTYYMVEAALKFRETLAQAEFREARFGVLSNFTGDFHDGGADAIKSRLFMQLFNPVRWYENLSRVVAPAEGGAELLLEFGGGLGKGGPEERRPALEGIVKKVRRVAGEGLRYFPVINARTLEECVRALG